MLYVISIAISKKPEKYFFEYQKGQNTDVNLAPSVDLLVNFQTNISKSSSRRGDQTQIRNTSPNKKNVKNQLYTKKYIKVNTLTHTPNKPHIKTWNLECDVRF